jgi:hypothetical protein
MKIGRPRFHQKARWITIDSPGLSQYYMLDERGRLVLNDGRVAPHHILNFWASYVGPAAQQRKSFPVPVFTGSSTTP